MSRIPLSVSYVDTVNIICLITISCTETGVDRSESMDSVINGSDDEKRLSYQSSDSQSDCSSKEIYKNIRTRYLSRVHSVSDPTKDDSIVEQAFYKSNLVKGQTFESDETLNEFKYEINNVTLDHSADDVSVSVSSEGEEILSDMDLGDIENSSEKRDIKRQDAIDLFNEKVIRQDAVDRTHTEDSDNNLNKKISSKLVIKLDSSVLPKAKPRTIFNRNLSGSLNGKPKSFSMDNLNNNNEYKDALKEATSIEFYDGTKSFNNSELSLLTASSDNVFVSPIEKCSNKIYDKQNLSIGKYSASLDHLNIPQNIPVVKAESILPFPYPDDVRRPSQIDFFSQPFPARTKSPEIVLDEKVENDLKKMNEELKITFKSALDRMGCTNVKRSSSLPRSDKFVDVRPKSASEIPLQIKTLNTFTPILRRSSDTKDIIEPKVVEVKEKSKINFPRIDNITSKDFNSKSIHNNAQNSIDPDNKPIAQGITIKSNTKENNVVLSKDESAIETRSELDKTTDVKIDDSVSYRLKINTSDPCKDIEPKDSLVVINDLDMVDSKTEKTNKKLNTFLTPIKIVKPNGGNDESPIIISPVLIQPIFLKHNPSPVSMEVESKEKKTVYYDDTDQVMSNNKSEVGEPVANDNNKRASIYQKNIKTKPIPFHHWKKPDSNTTLLDNKLPANKSPREANKSSSEKLSKSPEWLIDNQYYQPLENVPFIINTVQTFTKSETKDVHGKEDVNLFTKKPFLPLPHSRRLSEENYYEEIGPGTSKLIGNKNIADDEKIIKKAQSLDEFSSITREDILNVPRKLKKPKNVLSTTMNTKNKEKVEMTKSVISLSKAPSANEPKKRTTRSLGELVQSFERKSPSGNANKPEVPLRKYSLQNQKSATPNVTTGSLPRDKPYWKTLEHKRLSHPIRSLNDNLPPRPLRKLGF